MFPTAVVRPDHIQVCPDEGQPQQEVQVCEVDDHEAEHRVPDQADGEIEGLDAAHAEGHVHMRVVCWWDFGSPGRGDGPYEPVEDQSSGCCEDA